MSQHIFNTKREGDDITVMMGWDRPLQGYFMTVTENRTNNDKYIYSNLDDPELAACGGMAETIEPFAKKLDELNIEIPLEMFDAVQLDGIFNAGNKVVHHTKERAND